MRILSNSTKTTHNMEEFFTFVPNPNLFKAGTVLLIISFLFSYLAKSSKLKYGKLEVPVGRSKAALSNKKRETNSAVALKFLAIPMILCSFVPAFLIPNFTNSNRPSSKTEDIYPLNISCIPTECHQNKNYGLTVADFPKKYQAENFLNLLHEINATNPQYFSHTCSSMTSLDEHLVFVNRRFNTYSSALDAKEEYKKVLAKNEVIGKLCIVKFLEE